MSGKKTIRDYGLTRMPYEMLRPGMLCMWEELLEAPEDWESRERFVRITKREEKTIGDGIEVIDFEVDHPVIERMVINKAFALDFLVAVDDLVSATAVQEARREARRRRKEERNEKEGA